MRDAEYAFIRELVYEHSRINLGAEKRELVSARLGRRLRATRLTSISDYCKLLRSDSGRGELPHLIDAISTNHTHFFREPRHFDFLTEMILPEFLKSDSALHGPELAIWSAACSSGEEAYSIAITLAQKKLPASVSWRIDATDISYRILDQARQAIYPERALESIPGEALRRYFDKGHSVQEGRYRVSRDLRRRVNFQRLNLLTDKFPFQRPFAVIFCRNVMIYFDRATQTELVHRLYGFLKPGGYLFVGHSESLAGVPHDFEYIRPAVYRRKP